MRSTIQRELEHGTRLYKITFTNAKNETKATCIRCENVGKAIQILNDFRRIKTIESVETITIKGR